MASVHKRSISKYWYASLRVPMKVDPQTGRVLEWKQTTKSTGQTERGKAERAAQKMEEEMRKHAGAGSERSERLFGVLQKAADYAVKDRLSEPLARQLMAEIYAESAGRELECYTVQGWLDEWVKRKEPKVSRSTMYLYKVAAKSFVEWLGERSTQRLELIRREDLIKFLEDAHKEGRSAKTANQYKKALGIAFRQATQSGLLLANPADGIENLPEEDSVDREPFSEREIAALVTAAQHDPEWRTVILIGAYTGLRLSNCTRMRWSDVNLEKGEIQIQPVKQRRAVKRKKILRIPLHNTLATALSTIPVSDDPVSFLFPRLSQVSVAGRKGLTSEFKEIMKKAGIDRKVVRSRDQGHRREVAQKSFHSLRHASNSMMAEAGVSQELRREILGHTSDAMNDIYTHLTDGSLKRAVDALPSL